MGRAVSMPRRRRAINPRTKKEAVKTHQARRV
jgi:hypothetical protein